MSYFGRKLGCKIDNFDIADWGLIVSKRTIALPEYKNEEQDIAGMDGTADYSEIMNGDVSFKRTKITLVLGPIDKTLFTYALNEGVMMRVLHGGEHKIIFDDDPFYYYIGRFRIKEFTRDAVLPTITLEINAMPFKFDVEDRIVTANICTTNSMDYANVQMFETSADRINNKVYLVNHWRFVISGSQPSVSRWWVPVEPDTFYAFSYRTDTTMTPGYAEITDMDGNILDPSGFKTGPHNAITGDFIILNLHTQSWGSAVFLDVTLIKPDITICKNGRQRVFPEIEATEDCIALFEGKAISLPAGKYDNFDVYFKAGDNKICFYGRTAGTVKLRWRRGELPYVSNLVR